MVETSGLNRNPNDIRRHHKRNLIVVPDGLASDRKGHVLYQPSFVYRWVLNGVANIARPDDTIYLAPANTFGGARTEQEIGHEYLRDKVCCRVVSFLSPTGLYVDTRGNARLLRRYLEENDQWPLSSVVLIAYHIHMRRAYLVFKQEEFEISEKLDIVQELPKRFKNEPVVPRLWYYRFPIIHRIYEVLAYWVYRLQLK